MQKYRPTGGALRTFDVESSSSGIFSFSFPLSTSTESKAVHTTLFSLAGNAVLALVKGVAGYFGNSYALQADAIESLSDVFSSLLLLFGLKYASRPPDEDHPYGHGRAEPLLTFVIVGFLIGSAAVIIWQSLERIRTPHPVPETYTLWIIGAIIIVKESFYRWVKKRSQESHSTALAADAWHHRADALTSLTAFFGILIAVVMGPGYEAADDWAALLASGLIIFNSYLIFRPALGEIMDEHRYDDLVRDIRAVALTIPGVVGTDECLVRKLGMKYLVDVHLVVPAEITVRQGHALAHTLKDVVMARFPNIADVLVHVEPDEDETEERAAVI